MTNVKTMLTYFTDQEEDNFGHVVRVDLVPACVGEPVRAASPVLHVRTQPACACDGSRTIANETMRLTLVATDHLPYPTATSEEVQRMLRRVWGARSSRTRD